MLKGIEFAAGEVHSTHNRIGFLAYSMTIHWLMPLYKRKTVSDPEKLPRDQLNGSDIEGSRSVFVPVLRPNLGGTRFWACTIRLP